MKLIMCALAGFLVVIGLNVTVDPYGIFFWVDRPGFNAYKPDVLAHWRTAKALRVRLIEPDALLVGSSRVLAGMDPRHPSLAAFKRPYNYAVPGPTMCELANLTDLALAAKVPRRMVIGLDLFAANAVFAPSLCRLPDNLADPLLAFPRALVSIDTFNSMQKTLIKQRNPDPTVWQPTPDGLAHLTEALTLHKGGPRTAFTQAERTMLDTQFLPLPVCRFELAPPGTPDDALLHLVRMLREAHGHGIDTQLVIHPSHARLELLEEAAGLRPAQDEWKRRIVALNEAEAKRAGRLPFPVWDFSGVNSVTTEPVPPAGDTTSVMRYYWDSSHYKTAAGDLMFDRMYGTGTPPADFGVRLGPANIEAHLARQRRARDAYAASHPEDAAEVRSIAKQVLARPGCGAGKSAAPGPNI